MKLYKFRPLRRDFDFVLDVLVSERLYCAEYHSLNDPLEGYFVEEFGPVPGLFQKASRQWQVSDLEDFKNKPRRICSLSATLSDIVLWSHYADGHMGVAIEVEFDEAEEVNLHRVTYSDAAPPRTIDRQLVGFRSVYRR